MTTVSTAFEPQWVGAIPSSPLPLSTYLVGVSGVATSLAVILALSALVWLLRSSRPHHALAEQAAWVSAAALVVAVVVTTLGTAFDVSLGGWWWLLIGAWSVAAVAAARVRVVGSRRRSHSRGRALTDEAQS